MDVWHDALSESRVDALGRMQDHIQNTKRLKCLLMSRLMRVLINALPDPGIVSRKNSTVLESFIENCLHRDQLVTASQPASQILVSCLLLLAMPSRRTPVCSILTDQTRAQEKPADLMNLFIPRLILNPHNIFISCDIEKPHRDQKITFIFQP
ncbi:hypothetical protein F3I20_07465 [Candidatus Pantoea gossypiicola]|uniref:Uncharacterized protein n=1 Tax=Candidatus Pantoea gossypiicola TaxID=2608008 RepID=A0AB34CL51_9GAMM|nr:MULTISPECIES: hypothetical protein [Pantoea]KAA5987888.1 hypothetical protein F3I49_05155 [Pantoea sp. M_4]KAA6126886.1 hypothetical protein F3I20_07465 [Pantoea gossypiicola]